MLEAHPQRGDKNLAAATSLATMAGQDPAGDNDRTALLSALRDLNQAIEERSGAAEAQRMLLRAIAAAGHWASSPS